MNDNMPSNSNKAAETRQTVTKPIAKANKAKKSFFRNVADNLFDTDGLDGARLDITHGIFIPAIKNVVLETVGSVMSTVTDAFELALFGTVSKKSRRTGYTSYGKQYRDEERRGNVTIIRGSEDRDRRTISDRARTTHDFSEIVFEGEDEAGRPKTQKENMDDAKEVLETMCDMLDIGRNAYVTVADLYDLCDIRSTYQDRKWGWRSMAGAHPEALRGRGVMLHLPKPEYLG